MKRRYFYIVAVSLSVFVFSGAVFTGCSVQSRGSRDQYEAVKNKALELHTPVLNQNRFLYFVGFFDQARK